MLAKSGYGKEPRAGCWPRAAWARSSRRRCSERPAFIIAEFLKISYLDVIKMATVPTLLYYFSLFLMVELDARKYGMSEAAFEIVESAWTPVEALLVPLPVADLDRDLHGDRLLAHGERVLGDGDRLRGELLPARIGDVSAALHPGRWRREPRAC
jgi:hypothetical protein